jgi:hypothetical protein
LIQIVDLSLDVNVEFMLCPTASMHTIFALVPDWILWPSYRSTLTIAVMIIAWPISYSYIAAGHLLRLVFGRKNALIKTK